MRKFRGRYGNRQGVWLSKTLQDADRYQSYGELKTYQYYRANIVCDLGQDGIYVLLGTPWSPPEPIEGEEAEAPGETLDLGDQPILEPAPDAVPGGARKSRRKRGYMFYPSGLGATKE